LLENVAFWSARKLRSRKIDTVQVESLIASRSAARKAKDWAASDRIRDELAAMGVVLKDSKDGTTWEVAR
jgi:cysteinyl-tRNA synthetase